MKHKSRLSFLVLFLAATTAVLVGARGRAPGAGRPTAKVTVEVAPAVKEAVDREVGDGRVVGLSSGQDQDKNLIWFVHAVIADSAYTIRLDPDGTLIDKECDEPDPDPKAVAPDELPEAVKATLKAEAGAAAPGETTRQEKQVVFQMEVKIAGHPYTLRIDADGKLLSKERIDDTSGKSAA